MQRLSMPTRAELDGLAHRYGACVKMYSVTYNKICDKVFTVINSLFPKNISILKHMTSKIVHVDQNSSNFKHMSTLVDHSLHSTINCTASDKF